MTTVIGKQWPELPGGYCKGPRLLTMTGSPGAYRYSYVLPNCDIIESPPLSEEQHHPWLNSELDKRGLCMYGFGGSRCASAGAAAAAPGVAGVSPSADSNVSMRARARAGAADFSAADTAILASMRGGGAAGAMRMPMPSLPLMPVPVNRQEPMKLGMFEGSVTLLSAQVDPDESEAAIDAVRRGPITGRNMVRGMFGTPITDFLTQE